MIRRLLLVKILLFFSGLAAYCPTANMLYMEKPSGIDPYKKIWNAVCIVESNCDPLALNPGEQAHGIAQIRPIRLNDFKKRSGISYQIEEMYDIYKSKRVFYFYAERIGWRNYEQIAKRWNGSGRMTLIYWEKVKKHL